VVLASAFAVRQRQGRMARRAAATTRQRRL
jgi:hypothetical protein